MTRARIYWAEVEYTESAGGGVTGTGTITTGAVTASSTGEVSSIGTGDATITAITSTASGTLTSVGTGAGTITAITSSAVGNTGAIEGTGAGTIAAITSSAAGKKLGFTTVRFVQSNSSSGAGTIYSSRRKTGYNNEPVVGVSNPDFRHIGPKRKQRQDSTKRFSKVSGGRAAGTKGILNIGKK